MRHVSIALGTVLCLGLLQAWHSNIANDAERLAIDLRCGGQQGAVARNCRALHAKLYRAGTLDPERALRAHCSPPKTREFIRRRPPALCVERYGGWHREG